ncbi:MAG TPA: allophanate hydrolase subunit 1 [Marmoricola sp.]|nr:allophanate hydrolase subunit 1 [Marmoricola sp.]
MQLRRVGERALLVECSDLAEVTATYAALHQLRRDLRATEIVPAARTVLLDGLADVAATRALLDDLAAPPGVDDGSRAAVVEIPVIYDGPDLGEVARQWAVSESEVVQIHQSTTFVVAFCGFAPGFAYCAGLPPDRTVRRRSEPRPRVPAGSVALAGEFSAVYPTPSPGGWQLIGSTRTRVWRPDHDRPALLEPGTRVTFVDG